MDFMTLVSCFYSSDWFDVGACLCIRLYTHLFRCSSGLSYGTARNLLFGVDVYGQENVRFEERWKRGKKKRTVPTEH